MRKTGLLLGLLGAVLSVVTAASCGGAQDSHFGKDGSGGSGGIHLGWDGGNSETGGGHCTGIQCNVESCSGGTQTTVSGYVYAPNGQLPLYDVQVFIPNSTLDPLPK